MGCGNLRTALCARLDGREDPARMVRFSPPVAADRTSLIPSLSLQTRSPCYLAPLSFKPYGGISTHVDSERVLYISRRELLGSFVLWKLQQRDRSDRTSVKGSWTTQMTGWNSVATRCSPSLSSSFLTTTATTTMSFSQSISFLRPGCRRVCSRLFGSLIHIG